MRQQSASVRLIGIGPAGLTLTWLLLQRGFNVTLVNTRPLVKRVVAIPLTTLQLIAHLWKIELKSLMNGLIIKRKAVSWREQMPQVINELALVCELSCWNEYLFNQLKGSGVKIVEEQGNEKNDPEEWQVITGGGYKTEERLVAGQRIAISGKIESIPEFDYSTMVIAAVNNGWLAAMPTQEKSIAFILVKPNLNKDENIEEHVYSALKERWPSAKDLIVQNDFSIISVAPKLVRVPINGRMLYAGDAALSVDPLRGDGIGYAIRGALLAQAVITGISNGTSSPLLAEYYAAKLNGVFRIHLENCQQHYSQAYNYAIWQKECQLMQTAIHSLSNYKLSSNFRLIGFDLKSNVKSITKL